MASALEIIWFCFVMGLGTLVMCIGFFAPIALVIMAVAAWSDHDKAKQLNAEALRELENEVVARAK